MITRGTQREMLTGNAAAAWAARLITFRRFRSRPRQKSSRCFRIGSIQEY